VKSVQHFLLCLPSKTIWRLKPLLMLFLRMLTVRTEVINSKTATIIQHRSSPVSIPTNTPDGIDGRSILCHNKRLQTLHLLQRSSSLPPLLTSLPVRLLPLLLLAHRMGRVREHCGPNFLRLLIDKSCHYNYLFPPHPIFLAPHYSIFFGEKPSQFARIFIPSADFSG